MYERLREHLGRKVPDVALAFLGLGIVQGWLAALQAAMQGTVSATASTAFGRATLFVDVGSVPVFLLVIALAGRLAPLWGRRGVKGAALALMYAGGAAVASIPLVPRDLAQPAFEALAAGPLGGLANFVPDAPGLVGMAGLVLAGAGAALLELCWWELYAVLNPVEAALCFAASWIVREAAAWALAGCTSDRLVAAVLALPLVALLMLDAARARAGRLGLAPRTPAAQASFPWKPMALVACYAFAYGCGTWLLRYQDDAFMHLGMVLPAALVCASVLVPVGRFDFPLVYRIILPAAIFGFLALLLVQDAGPGAATGAATVLVRASYTSVFLYVSVVLCNLSRRYGMSAAWLFSLFNIVHIAFLGAGTLLFNALPSLVVIVACIGCILLATFIIVSEPTLDSSWRIVLTGGRAGSDLAEQARLELVVDSLAREHGLSERQREILLLIAQGDTPRALSNRLGISAGTVKAHVQHIYRKLGIHSKEELDALIR